MKVFYIFLIALTVCWSGFASELFIRVNATGEYFASANEQTIYTTSNIFKFYDLDAGMISVQVLNRFNNQLLYNNQVFLKANERVVAEIDNFGNFTIVNRFRIRILNWYTTEISGNNSHQPPGNNGGVGWNNPGNGKSSYNDFLIALKNELMDSDKLLFAKNYARSTNLKAKQIAEIAKQFSFDANRLEFAKYAYDYCFDKQNYFQLKSSFSFTSNYNALVKYIEEK